MSVTVKRVKGLLRAAAKSRVLVVGDVMLDQFLWGRVKRISPEAPVPVVEFQSETYMPGGAANVARNLTALGADVGLYGLVGKDDGAKMLKQLLKKDSVDSSGLIASAARMTTRKTRVIAHQQQMLRVDRETNDAAEPRVTKRLLGAIEAELEAEFVIAQEFQIVVFQHPQLCIHHHQRPVRVDGVGHRAEHLRCVREYPPAPNAHQHRAGFHNRVGGRIPVMHVLPCTLAFQSWRVK